MVKKLPRTIKEVAKHVFRAMRHSFAGFRAAYSTELAFRVEIFLSFFIFPLAFYVGQTAIEQIILVGSWFFVLIMELVNTAIETIINRISREHHHDSGKAKDIGSALVFVSAIQAKVVWSIIIKNLTFGVFTCPYLH
jgi:diacylglycerol kinase (ATP)